MYISVTGKLCKQVDDISMGGTLSITLPDYFMNKMGKRYCIAIKTYVYNTYKRRKKNELDKPFSKMNPYHPNINLTIEINPSKFLDTKIAQNKNKIK